ncbi:RodZ domain-containing protein [Moritella dasanensis]|uniref:RodZ domain-containing protein n=1 Tax=Moritella dasanensis TaxID=428031 RepID=UPI0002FA0249|nr:RodZ domain-containing protein [Moritella dasanensis]
MTIDLETLKDPDKTAELQDNIDVVTAGQILQDARIASGISVQEVSNNIHLKLSVINNIEQSVCDKHISPTFMRGYIRCYARFLKISEDEVIAAYDCQNVVCEQQAELQSFSRRTKLEAHDNRLMLVSYGIIGFMLIVFLIWGLRGDDVDVVVPEPIATQVAVAPDSTVASDVVITSEESTPILVSPEQVVIEPTSVTETLAVKPEQPLVVTQPAVASPVITNTVNNKPAIVAQSLVLTFAGDCWIQVKDSSGKTLSTGVRKAGQTIELQGLAPLSIKLGAPEQVTLSYAGEPVDLSTFKQGRLAKFKLPFEA